MRSVLWDTIRRHPWQLGLVLFGIAGAAFLHVQWLELQQERAALQAEAEAREREQQEERALLNISWELAEHPAPWEARDAHSMEVFQDALWLLGGVEGPGIAGFLGDYWTLDHKSDLFKSADGERWELVSPEAPWGKRRSLALVLFHDKLWALGGWNQNTGYDNAVWVSSDGVDWSRAAANAPWPQREGHTLTAFQDKLWLAGGVNFQTREAYRDVWYSADGVDWELAGEAPWSPRYDHTVTAFQDKLWLIGGVPLGADGNGLGDIWSSSDGVSWELAAEAAPFPPRHGHTALVYKDRLWVLSGWDTVQDIGLRDAWFSKDGKEWKKTAKPTPWEGREDHASAVFRDRIWVTGGMKTGYVWSDEIWHTSALPTTP